MNAISNIVKLSIAVCLPLLISGCGGGSGGASPSTTTSSPRIVFDYTYDTNGFFTPERRALMEAAATSLTARMTGTTWARVDPVTSGGAYDLAFINPSTLGITWNHNVVIPENQITVYLGATNWSTSPFSSLPSTGDSTTQLLSINNVSGGIGNVLTNPAKFRPINASITFDLQGIQGFSSINTRQWYFSSVANLKIDDRNPTDPHYNNYTDFYASAIHELGHVLGIYNPFQTTFASTFNLPSDPNFENSWLNQVQSDGLGGYVFTGSHAKQYYYGHVGQNIPLLLDKNHWADGVQSVAAPTVSATGWTFTSVNHDPNLPFRVGFSELEFGALQDIGYTITSGPSLNIQLN